MSYVSYNNSSKDRDGPFILYPSNYFGSQHIALPVVLNCRVPWSCSTVALGPRLFSS